MAKQRKTSSSGAAAKVVHTNDGYANFGARLGWGADNQQSGSSYALSYQGRNRVWLEAAYRGSWIVGAAVNAPAEDMTRAGIDMSGIDPKAVERLERGFEAMALWERLCEVIKWSRLYGGALAVLLIEGQDMSTPLRLDAVGKGQFKGLLVLDRWMVSPSLGDRVKAFGPEMGKPRFYDLLTNEAGLPVGRIHHTRVLRFEGGDLPHYQRVSENGWGLSILEPMWDRLVAFDSATVGASQLVYKAHLRTVKIDGLREIVSIGGPAMRGLLKQMDFIRQSQSNEGLTVLDGKDTFETQQYSFSGLSDIISQFANQLSGATGIPITRLFGQSSPGLGSSGEGEMSQYHERIAQDQEQRLRSPVYRLLCVMAMSLLGAKLPDEFQFSFRSLERMNDIEKADIAGKVMTAVTGAVDAGLIDVQTGMQELKASSHVTGIFGNITQDQIDAAAPEEPPAPDLGTDLAPVQTGDSLIGRWLRKRR